MLAGVCGTFARLFSSGRWNECVMNNRDIELLSAYLDGELKPSHSIKLEARLKTDPELASVLNDLRVTRTLLRKLPSRKAPRNFTLTRKMVGLNPPLPRTY